MKGGRREGAGRKPGSVNQMSAKAREQAAKTGELPHEFLLRVSRGEAMDGYAPTFQERMDAAKAAAPYFAPRLSTSSVDTSITLGSRAVQELTDEELRAIAAGGALTE